VRAVWDFVAGGSRVTPFGIALALVLAAGGTRFGWSAWACTSLYVGALLATLAAAAFERS
jgi:hypothetical protein